LYRWRGEELGMKLPSPLNVQVENAQAVSFSKETCVHSKFHGTFDVRDSWARELHNKFELTVVSVSTSGNCADFCTKAHSTHRFQQLMRLISGGATNKALREQRVVFFLRTAENFFMLGRDLSKIC